MPCPVIGHAGHPQQWSQLPLNRRLQSVEKADAFIRSAKPWKTNCCKAAWGYVLNNPAHIIYEDQIFAIKFGRNGVKDE